MGLLALLGISLNPLSYLSSFIKDLFSAALNLFGQAASSVVAALLGFITTTSDPVFSGGWWSSSGEQVFVKVLAVSGTMMALAFMLSVITATLASDQSILTKALVRLPIAAIEMALLTTVTAALLSATDEVSSYIASGTSHGLSEFAGAAMVAAIVDTGVVGLIIGGLLILAGLAVWAQLLIRTALLYCAVMAGPFVFAAAVHPSASGLRKRYIEFGLSIILSKLVVALAFATASAMVGGVSSSASFAQAVGALLEALAILLIACFAPFILIRLIIGAEAIVAAEGLERRPLRAATSGAQAAYYARGLSSTFKQMGAGGKSHGEDGGGSPSSGSSPGHGGSGGPPSAGSGPGSGASPSPGHSGDGHSGGRPAKAAPSAGHAPSTAPTTAQGGSAPSARSNRTESSGSPGRGSRGSDDGPSSTAAGPNGSSVGSTNSPATAGKETAISKGVGSSSDPPNSHSAGGISVAPVSGHQTGEGQASGTPSGGRSPQGQQAGVPSASPVVAPAAHESSGSGGDGPAPTLETPNAPPPPRRPPNPRVDVAQHSRGPSVPAPRPANGEALTAAASRNALRGLETNRRPDEHSK
jgi:hypothetical protein